ncbi:MAG: tRNA1(Val) (adenine(37)-N6)-methyltransferase [Clostridia bacterium]|nr:tRNA1(Val) (adenine(37)-N6)-methyltransferase [Clostridia bacterium]
MNILLEENERIDDLEYKGLKIIQNKNGFCFGIDAVLLSDFAKEIKKGADVLDLGTGTGIISVLLCAKTSLKHITGIEIQTDVYKMAKKSIELNNLQDKFTIINEDIKKISKKFPANSFDAIVTNPPYKKKNTGLQSNDKGQLISRHEVMCNLDDIVKASANLLNSNCSIYMVHRPNRLIDVIETLKRYKLEPKKIRFVYPKIGKEPNLILIKATKGGKDFLKIEKPLIIYNEDGSYTKEILKIYNKKC